jgi:protein gp37
VSDHSAIQWTEATWNPVTGCSKVSPGCDHCYAERLTERFHGKGSFAEVKLHPDRLDQPLRWRRPRRVFVNSMSDLFHESVPDDYIAHTFAIMAATPRHTYQVLTKRHGRMRSLLSSPKFQEKTEPWRVVGDNVVPDPGWPLPNVWLGVSVEDQHWADIRIPTLLDTPAAIRFLSCEPLLGPVDLRNLRARNGALIDCLAGDVKDPRDQAVYAACPGSIDWVIIGGESGPGARPMELDWARHLIEQCAAADVACFVKQLGSVWARGLYGDSKGGHWDLWPADLRVRDYPQTVAVAS